MSKAIKHAFIVPLIGGQCLGQERAFGSRPDYILSYDVFKSNDEHILNYYRGEVPYYVLDKGDKHPHEVDVVGATCPCAGLSSLSMQASGDNKMNDWMLKSAEYVLGQVKPKVFWGENAPGFAGKVGKPVVAKLRKIAKENGYTLTIYRTKSLLHGVPQVRERSFYYFWRNDRTFLLNYIRRDVYPIEQLILDVNPKATQMETTNPKKPSEEPFYQFVLEEVEGGITHREFAAKITKECNAMSYLEEEGGRKYDEVARWMRKNGHEKVAERCLRVHEKLEKGLNVMRHCTQVPKHHIGAFVGHYPTSLAHPVEDRYITYREAMSIMGLPEDYELLDPKRRLNHVCQNVPVSTATDAATQIRLYLEGRLEPVNSSYICQSNHRMDHENREEITSGNSLETFIS